MKQLLHRGFTLLEVMIALVILSVAFSAIIYSVNTGARDLVYLSDKTAATWVASNVLTEAQLGLNSQSFGRMNQLNQQWFWQLKSEISENPQIEKVTVIVSKQQRSAPIAQLEGFLKRDAE